MRVRVLEDVTLANDLWYIIETDEGVCKNRLYLRRYVDFCSLFRSLKDSTANVGGKVSYGMRRRIFVLPDLPPTNWFKIMFKSWGVGSSRRVLVGLQRWLEVVLEYIATEEDEPLIERFFGEEDVPNKLGNSQAKLLWKELERVHPGLASGVTTVKNLTALPQGTEVILKNLQKMQLYNGQLGRITGYNQEKDSYKVVLRSGRVWSVSASFIAEYKEKDGRPLPLPVGLGDSQPCHGKMLPAPSVDMKALLANVARPRPPDLHLAPWEEGDEEPFVPAMTYDEKPFALARTWDEEPFTAYILPEASDTYDFQNTSYFPAHFIASPKEVAEALCSTKEVAEDWMGKSSSFKSCEPCGSPLSVERYGSYDYPTE